MMSNGYRVLSYGVLDTFLLGPAECIKREQLCLGQLFFFFFLNPNLYSARVQLGTEAVTCVTTYYAYEKKGRGQ